MRYTYARARTYDRAADMLESMFAEGDVSEGEFPKIEAIRDHRGRVLHYAITLLG